MRIIDTFNEINSCYVNGKFNMQSWRKYVNNVSLSLAEKLETDSSSYNFDKDVEPVLQLIIDKKADCELAHNSFLKVTQDLQDRIKSVLKCDMDVNIIFYLGLCNGAGWATELDGKKVILLGIEKIVELSWISEEAMIALIYHELGYIWHFENRHSTQVNKTAKDKALWQIYTEGMAMYIEQLLCDNMNFYHQDKNGWLDWCKENRELLYEKFLYQLYNDGDMQQFFGDWNEFMGKSDVGYYLGAELIKKMSKGYDLMELANLELSEIEEQLKKMCG